MAKKAMKIMTSTTATMASAALTQALAITAAGAAVMALSIACSGAGAEEVSSAGVETGPELEVTGRSFADASPIDERPDLVSTPEDARFQSGGGKPVGVGGLAGSVDPEMLTPEALALNPLEIGVEKRAPFKLAPGADPLDPHSYDWEQDEDGYWVINYSDLSLSAVDKETLLDALVYPEEYEDSGEEVDFPDRIRALDGKKVSLTGYMIAMRWNKDKLQHFMLVRDLKACCFGGQPEADEWVDVPMNTEGTSYIQFVPVVTRGTFRLTGSSDDAGYAVGAYKIEGDDSREE